MKHEKTFRAFVTTFDDPSDIDDCTIMYADPNDEDECDCMQHIDIGTSCGETRCRFCGRRVG